MKIEEKTRVNEIELASLRVGDHFVLPNEIVSGPCLCKSFDNTEKGTVCYYYNYAHEEGGWLYGNKKVILVNILPESKIVWQRK